MTISRTSTSAFLCTNPIFHHFCVSVEEESSSALISRILRKSGLDKQAQETLKSASSSSGQSSGSLQYEYEGGRWLLSDGKLLERRWSQQGLMWLI